MSRCMTLVNNGIASRKKLEHSHDSPASSQLGQSAPGQSRSTPSKRFTLALLLAAISLNNDDKPNTSSPPFACLKYRPPSTPLHGRSKPATLQFYRLLGNFQPRSFTVMAHLNRKRLIRRAPLRDRIMAYFDPHDIDIWLREKLEAADWDAFHKRNGTPLGIALNVTALVARLSSGTRNGNEYDDLYIEEDEGSSFWSWLVSFRVCREENREDQGD